MFEIEIRQAFLIGIIASGVPLLVSTVLGLIVSFLQAITQIQEQTLGHVVRSGSVTAVLFLCGSWLGQQLIEFIQQLYAGLARLG